MAPRQSKAPPLNPACSCRIGPARGGQGSSRTFNLKPEAWSPADVLACISLGSLETKSRACRRPHIQAVTISAISRFGEDMDSWHRTFLMAKGLSRPSSVWQSTGPPGQPAQLRGSS